MIPLVDPALETYAAEHSAPVPSLLEELRQLTYDQVASPQMIVDQVEGQFLRLLVGLLGARRVLEVGCFTGYSALMMASTLPDDGQLITCEIDPAVAKIARDFFARSPDGGKIELRLGPALETLGRIDGPFDMVFLDADKEHYPDYLEAVLPMLRAGGLLVADNVLWSAKVIDPSNDEESTRALRCFNDLVRDHTQLEPVLLTVRDGMTLARRL